MSAILRVRTLAVLSFLVAAFLVASTFTFTPSAEAASRRVQKLNKAVDIVRAQKGDWYQYGAAGPNRFDCSGLIYYSYRKAGISVPRTSSQLANASQRIRRGQMRRGDLMFFHSGGRVYHVGVFTGRRNAAGQPMMIHSPRSGSRVHTAAPWTSSWFAGTLR